MHRQLSGRGVQAHVLPQWPERAPVHHHLLGAHRRPHGLCEGEHTTAKYDQKLVISRWNIYVPQYVLVSSELTAGAMVLVKLSCRSHLILTSAQALFCLDIHKSSSTSWHVTLRQLCFILP